MERITYIKIAGKEYPMSFSLGAAKKLISKYGSAEKMNEKLKKDGGEEGKIEMVLEILELLITQGCAYKNYFEKDMPKPENAPIEEGKWTPVPKEILEIAILMDDVEEITKKIESCISKGGKKEVETKPTGKKTKATRG